MYGAVLSVLLLGMVPVRGMEGRHAGLAERIGVARPAQESTEPFEAIARRLTASGILIFDLDSGQTLYARGETQLRPMASLTKLMTALLIVENHDLGERVEIPPGVASLEGSKANLRSGDTYVLGDLLTALLVESANDAAVTLAEYHSGSVAEFVEEMNRRAAVLGLRDTTFENPIGLDALSQRSTARDLAWLATHVLRHPAIAERMATKTAVIHSLSGAVVSLSHTHMLLHSSSLITAGKTGTTDDAGQCLFSLVEYEGRRYGVVFLHSSDRYADMRRTLGVIAN